ncbi:unnamed protein product [Prorocentrum cordatum]|uniref:Uncharacterized protein n=1 Tax=Prorocentrum cordatum TaxID=2364126 RepID=A0ABN9RTH7_9DINO|nr:unnamed protein product [Polarella glacialis]|mmetsp:Transcript_75146/g.203184  ORF Transcript_75146/g.203184 Transcript_75146/m.203184 type:complete len:254 (+) Transcript_75146:50-811(+)
MLSPWAMRLPPVSKGEREPLRGPGPLLDGRLSAEIRKGFVRKVYGVLSTQLLVTLCIAGPVMAYTKQLSKQDLQKLWAVGTIGSMLVIFAMHCCRSAVRAYPWAALLTFSAFKGLLFGALSAHYSWQSLLLALGNTVLIFAAMTAYGVYSKTDYTGYGPYVHAAMFTFMFFGFTLGIMGWCGVHIHWMRVAFDLCGVLVFTFMIMFDTQRILGEWGGHQYQFSVDDWMFAALTLYTDITQVFMHLLRLVGKRP